MKRKLDKVTKARSGHRQPTQSTPKSPQSIHTTTIGSNASSKRSGSNSPPNKRLKIATTSSMIANKQRRCHSPISPMASEAVENNNNLARILFPEAAHPGRNVVHFESRPAAPTPNPQRSSSTPKGEETTVQLDLGLLAPGNWVNDLAMMRIASLFKSNTLAIVNPLELEHFCKAKHLPDKVRDKYLIKMKHNPVTVHAINNSAEIAALYATSIHLVTHGSPPVAASHLRVRAESNLAAKHARIPPPCRCSGPQRPTAC